MLIAVGVSGWGPPDRGLVSGRGGVYAVASLGVAHLGVRTWAVGEGRNVSGLGLVSVFLSRAAPEGGFAQGASLHLCPTPQQTCCCSRNRRKTSAASTRSGRSSARECVCVSERVSMNAVCVCVCQ